MQNIITSIQPFVSILITFSSIQPIFTIQITSLFIIQIIRIYNI